MSEDLKVPASSTPPPSMTTGQTTAQPSAAPSVAGENTEKELAVDPEKEKRTSGAPSGDSFSESPPEEAPVAEKSGRVRDPEDDAAEDSEDDYEYPKAWRLSIITIALCLSVFCMALDNTIISTAIPKITDHFRALNDVGWYGSAYLLTTCAFQLLYGKFYSFFSIKWTYLFAMFIFEVGSLICGIAPTSVALIVGRAVAGLGAAGIFSGAVLIVSFTVPLKQRPIYTGLVGAMYGIASVAGPLLGGVFTDRLSWRWCFYINLPLGAITGLFIIFFYQSPNRKGVAETSGREKLKHFDIYGTAVFVPAIICLLLALQWGGSQYPWGNWRIILLLVFFGVLILIFLAIQYWRDEFATVPPRIVKQRSVGAGAFFVACLGGAFFVMVYYIPIWFQAIKGSSATKSGIMNLPLVLSVVIFSLVAGGATTGLGYYTPFIIASSILMSVGAGMLTTWEVNTGHPQWMGYQILFGMGVGMGMQLPLIAVQTVLQRKDVPVGTAVIMFAQTLGGALFISVAQNIFTNKLVSNLMQVVPDLNPAIVLATGATTLRNAVPPNDLPGVLVAYNKAIDQTFYVSVALSALSIFGAVFMEWKSVKGKKKSAGGGA